MLEEWGKEIFVEHSNNIHNLFSHILYPAPQQILLDFNFKNIQNLTIFHLLRHYHPGPILFQQLPDLLLDTLLHNFPG